MSLQDSLMQENLYLRLFRISSRRDRKGMAWREDRQCDKWNVPYLPIDPQDVGRRYDSDVIRINSQSGKGGVNYILKQSFGISLPEKMKEEVGYLVKDVSDKAHKELTPDWVYHILKITILRQRRFLQLMNVISNRKTEWWLMR